MSTLGSGLRSINVVEGTQRVLDVEGKQAEYPDGRGPLDRPPFSIAISRQGGMNGRAIAEAVARRLGWKVFDREILDKVGQEMGVDPSHLESVDEKQKSWLTECVEALARVPSVSEPSYVRHLMQTMFSLASRGHCIFVGRGAAQVLPASSTLRVYLAAPLGERIWAARHRFNYSETDATAWVKRLDQERHQFIKGHFHRDPADLSHYDVILNPVRLGEEGCATLIVDALQALQKAR